MMGFDAPISLIWKFLSYYVKKKMFINVKIPLLIHKFLSFTKKNHEKKYIIFYQKKKAS